VKLDTGFTISKIMFEFEDLLTSVTLFKLEEEKLLLLLFELKRDEEEGEEGE
jgi:hypothetical protein